MQQQEPAAARLAQASSKPERGHLAYIQRLLGSGMRAVLAAAGDRAAEHDNGSRAKSLLRQAVTAGIALESSSIPMASLVQSLNVVFDLYRETYRFPLKSSGKHWGNCRSAETVVKTMEADTPPLVGFIFGNVDKDNRLDADYLDEDAKKQLGGLERVQGGGLNLQEELGPHERAAVDNAAVQPAADARDFADEAELIDDAEQQALAAAAAAAAQQRQLGMVSAALQAGAAAEEEDYDFDEEEQPPVAAAVPVTAAAATQVSTTDNAAAKVEAAMPLDLNIYRHRVRLPVLGKSGDGETVLRFSELYGHQGVMAGQVATTDELRPPPLLRRRHLQQAAGRHSQHRANDEAADEESLLLAADLEVPADEEDEGGEPEQPPAPERAEVEVAATLGSMPGQQPHQERDQHRSRAVGGASAQHAGAEHVQPDRLDDVAAAPGSDAEAPVGLPDSAFYAVNTLAWEDRIQWRGAPDLEPEPGAAAKEGTADLAAEGHAMEAGLIEHAAEQQPTLAAHADIAAMFQQQQPVPAQQPFQDPSAAANGVSTHHGLGAWQQQQQLGQQSLGGAYQSEPELPGLSSIAAAEAEARAAADSDEDESWALPMGPLLRLEQLEQALLGGEDGEQRKILPPAPDMLPVNSEEWEERIAWEGSTDAHKLRCRGPALDLNDSSQAFELTKPLHDMVAPTGRAQPGPSSAEGIAELVQHAAALVLEPQALALPLPPRGSGFNAVEPEEVELWRLQQGLARDREYFHQARRKAGTVGTVKVLHAKLAVDLATLPILNPDFKSQEEVLALAHWHTPRGKWWPIEINRVSMKVSGGSKKKATTGPVAVSMTITSLPGVSKTFQSVGLDSRLQDLWKHLVDNIAVFKAAAGARPLMLLPGKPPLALPLEHPLLSTGAVKGGQKQVQLTVAFQEIELLPSAVADIVPQDDNPSLLRPPNAFFRKRDFSAAEPGHVVLLEYMEQQPPLLNRPGMGAKLVTYYRKKDATDLEHQNLEQDLGRWRVGTVQPLGDDDDSPFLGQLARGTSSLSVESGLFRSLAFPYTPPHTDFLLLRSPAGTMQLRELSGTVVVGQELPMLRVPAPTAREVKDLEERRIYVHVFKHLRRQQAKLDKDPFTQGQRAIITLKALAEAFPTRPPATIRLFVKDACDLVVRPFGDTEAFSLKEGARPPSEAELRKKLTPEEACALEACYVAAFRMKKRGLVMHEKLDKAAIEKLRLAAEMLPPNDSYQKAARLVEQAMQSAPWTLTDAFVAHFREGKAQLQLAGAADPTGRGFGYSFVRDIRHKHANSDDVTKQMAKRQAGKVQGTDADLRRMTTAQAKERLRKYGLSEDEIQGLGRCGNWQMAVLNNTAAEDLGDQDALEAELERELAAAEEEAEGVAGAVPQSKKKGKRDGTPTPDDEQRMMQQMRAEGLMATPGGAGGAASSEAQPGTPAEAGAGGPAPKEGAGTRRILREVFLKAKDGSWQKSHEIIYSGRDRPGQLHSLYQVAPRSCGLAMLRPGVVAWDAAAAGLVVLAEGAEVAGAEAVRPQQLQFGDEMLDGDEMISDDGDFEYNEDAEAPYFAPIAAAEQPEKPKRSRSKKKQAVAPADSQQFQEALPALPDDFAAALAAATMVHQSSIGVPAEQTAPLVVGEQQAPSGADTEHAVQEPVPFMQQQEVAKPKLKLKMSSTGAPAKELPREPSPDFVYDFTAGPDSEEEDDEARRKRSGKAADADYEVNLEADDASDEFVPGEDDDFSEDDRDERPKKARNRAQNFDGASLARSGSRRSAGGAGGARRGSGAGARRSAGGGARNKAGSMARGKGGGVGSSRGKRSRSEFEYEEEEEFEEEFEVEDEEVELSDEEAELSEESDDAPATSDEGATPPPGRRKTVAAGVAAAFGGAGQLGTVGRQLGAILSSIVQQLRNMKMPTTLSGTVKTVREYEVVFGKAPSSKGAPDYHTFVPKSSIIILPEVQKKAKAGRYLSLEQFRADLQQLYRNAVAYNSPGVGGAFGAPYFIDLASRLLQDSERLIAEHMGEIQAAEAATTSRGW
ncbi:Transcription initiation factor TFIID subunit 1 [Chlorella vulgaris]